MHNKSSMISVKIKWPDIEPYKDLVTIKHYSYFIVLIIYFNIFIAQKTSPKPKGMSLFCLKKSVSIISSEYYYFVFKY